MMTRIVKANVHTKKVITVTHAQMMLLHMRKVEAKLATTNIQQGMEIITVIPKVNQNLITPKDRILLIRIIVNHIMKENRNHIFLRVENQNIFLTKILFILTMVILLINQCQIIYPKFINWKFNLRMVKDPRVISTARIKRRMRMNCKPIKKYYKLIWTKPITNIFSLDIPQTKKG